jgi:tetratricopeptide (TPR) repeat protein
MSKAAPSLVFALLFTVAFTLATSVQLRVPAWSDSRQTDGAFKKLLGDGRRLFAGQFVEIADVYLHSGYYPSIFDRRDPNAAKAVTGGTGGHENCEHEGHTHEDHDEEHEKQMAFLGPPRDWIEAFGRRFKITEHTHLEGGQEREVLPWLKLAIEMDPQLISTYTATAFWLRKHLGKIKEAEDVLREGIRNNPNSFEILFEMGVLYHDDYKDDARARNIWGLALKRWNAQSSEAKAASSDVYSAITINLARLENDAGNWQLAIQYFELAKQVSPHPEGIQKQIDEIESRITGAPRETPVFPPLP